MPTQSQKAPPPQQPTIPQEQPSLTISRFVGLKNSVAPERLTPEEFELAKNIDLDDAGEPRRRRGFTLASPGSFYSLFTSDSGAMYVVKDGVLGRVNPDASFVALESGLPTTWDPLAYVQVGPKIYFSGRTNAGIIDEPSQSVSPWLGPTPPAPPPTDSPQQVQSVPPPDFWYSPVVNPNAQLPPIRGRLLGPPPLADVLGYFNGRIYLAQGTTLWWTELYNYLYVDKTRNFYQFEADITMLGTVMDGIYVGTEEGVWFLHLAEGGAIQPRRVRVLDSGAIRGSMVYIPGELANPAQVPLMADEPVQVSILFLTTSGYCGGKDNGVCYNYSEDKFVFPEMEEAFALYRRHEGMHQYLVTGNSRGQPTSDTRIGDYIDATIRRAGTWRETTDIVTFQDYFDVTIIPGA
jgi:hypothetical protein